MAQPQPLPVKLFWAACFLSLVFLGVVTGTGNEQSVLNFNQPTTKMAGAGEDRMRRAAEISIGSNVPKKIDTADDDLQMVKRAPIGFTGMRGKKTSTDYDTNDYDIEPLARAASDDPNNNNNNHPTDYGQRYKKAPIAFYGGRGKKYTSGGNDFNHLNDLLQKIEENRMRQALLQDFLELSAAAENDVAKRAPTGFTGMRGKRPAINSFNDYNNDDDENIEKREYGRIPANAFLGVRGKKDVDHQNFKRSPGEKSMDSRVKQQRRFVDFSNKFVAVRGKKNFSSDDELTESDDSNNTNNNHNNALQWHLNIGRPTKQRYFINAFPRALLFGSSEKRTPSGFLGMRGKRSVNTTAEDNWKNAATIGASAPA